MRSALAEEPNCTPLNSGRRADVFVRIIHLLGKLVGESIQFRNVDPGRYLARRRHRRWFAAICRNPRRRRTHSLSCPDSLAQSCHPSISIFVELAPDRCFDLA
ncbi:unnamed protein product [Linum trigynum]|uniref:Uncharacterized protein n=1 Tax=Linum trigynum TaxID=586398 RepID=A0AAV2E8K1_9ROSI